MVRKWNLNIRIVLLTLLVLTSGSILNIIGVDEILTIGLFSFVFLLSIRFGTLTRRGFTLVSLLVLLVLLVLFALQAINAGDFYTILNLF